MLDHPIKIMPHWFHSPPCPIQGLGLRSVTLLFFIIIYTHTHNAAMALSATIVVHFLQFVTCPILDLFGFII